MGLRAKFNLVMLLAFAIGLGMTYVLADHFMQADARQEVLGEAAIMNGQANALAQFTVGEVAPLLADQMERRFLPQSIPAWVTQTNFRLLQKQFPDYSYNVVVENPTNPADRPTDWQADIIRILKSRPATMELVTERDTASGPILSVSRPVVINNPACLRCHSTPDAAPATMVDLYGPNNGFNWKLNEVLGAQIVSVPMSVPRERARAALGRVMIWMSGVFALMLVLLNLLLHFVIIRPVHAIAVQATEVSMGNMDAPEMRVRGRDEISALAEAFNRMRRSLANALKLLGE